MYSFRFSLNIVSLLCWIIWNTFFNQAYAFPRGCEVSGFGFYQHLLVLNASGKQSFYLINNSSNLSIELHRKEDEESFMTPPLIARITPSNWAAFACDIQNLPFECFINENANLKLVACDEVITVCQYPRVKFALSNMGNYWVSVNKSQAKVTYEAASKGILLHW